MGKKSRHRPERQVTAVTVPEVLPPPQANPRELFVAIAILIVAIAAVFAQVRSQELINYGDPQYLSENATALTAVFGLDAGAHKLVNVGFHAAAAILLLLFLFRATGELWPSAMVAALFALHPTRVESVAWVAERKDVLSAFFWMLALLLYARYVLGKRLSWLIGVIAAYACALMSKPSTITLPFVLLLLDWWPFRRFDAPNRAKLILEKLPLFALIVPAIVLTLRAQSAAIAHIPFGDRIANAFVAAASYLRMLVWPVNLAVFYPYRAAIAPSIVILAGVILIAISIAAFMSYRRAPFFTVGWLWFIGTLVPMSGLIQAGKQAMADRFTYIPYVGLFIAVVWGIQALVPKRVAAAAAVAVTLALCVLTFVQVSYWKNSETIFGRALMVTSRNALAHINVGSAMYARGAMQDSLIHYRNAVAIEPRNAIAHKGVADALAALGQDAEAIKEFRQALALDPNLPGAYRRLAQLELSAGHAAEAAELLAKAHPGGSEASAQAEIAAARGDVDAALEHYAVAVNQNPGDFELRNNFAAMLARKGRNDEALQQYLESIRLRPNYYDARMNVGALLSRMDRNQEASEHFATAAALRPNSPEPRVFLALIYANTGQAANAISEVDAALKIDRAAANRIFTDAVRMPFKETNFDEFRASLQAQVK